MLARLSEEGFPDLKGELETREFPVTCLKLELVLRGPSDGERCPGRPNVSLSSCSALGDPESMVAALAL